MNIYIALVMTVIVMLATVLACAWLGWNRKQKKTFAAALRAVTIGFMLAVQYVLAMPPAFKRWVENRDRYRTMANSYGAGTHEKVMGKFSAVAIASRHLLFKKGATDDLVVVAGVGDQPFCAIADEVGTTDLALVSKVPVAGILLGVTNDTVRMVASTVNCVVGAVVYPAAAGQVQAAADLPSGTHYAVGIVVSTNGAAPAAGDIIEVSSVVPLSGKTV